MTAPKYTKTRETITVVWEGKSHVVKKGAANFEALKKILENKEWSKVAKNVTITKSIEDWVQGKFTLSNDKFYYDKVELPATLNKRIVAMAAKNEDPGPLFKFWEKLQKNPSFRSVQQLWPFMDHKGIAFAPDGDILAYKSVRQDYRDHHSGEFDNHPGKILTMPRNQVSDDPNVACAEGFHFGSMNFAEGFNSGGRIIIAKINPADVVAVPYDDSMQKMRTCRYEVIGNHNGQYLSDTTHKEERVKGSKRKIKKSGRKFGQMNPSTLMNQSIEDLRAYATRILEIVGASKIVGGKVALVNKIVEVRKK